MSEWQDIGSAPRDGRAILLVGNAWAGISDRNTEPVVGHWYRDGWYMSVGGHYHAVGKITMWAPLPPAIIKTALEESKDENL